MSPRRGRGGRRRGPSVAGTALLLLAIVVVATLLVHGRYAGTGASPHESAPTAAPVAPSAAADTWKLVQLPQGGTGPLLSVITGARRSLDMTMYELQDPQVVSALVADEQRGVRVRVILDAAFSGKAANSQAYDELRSGGVAVKWGPPDTIVHQKTITADSGESDEVAAIGTGNLQQQYYSTTLDAWVLDTDQQQVAAIDATFASDWAVMPGRLGTAAAAPGIVWSPGDEAALVATIDSAKSSVQFSSEELSDKAIIAALAARAKAGVSCQILMTQQSEYDSALSELSGDGCSVHTYRDSSNVLYVHEKQIIVDDRTILIGSQNASVASLDYDRELSVVLSSSTAPAAVASAEAEYSKVFTAAAPWAD